MNHLSFLIDQKAEKMIVIPVVFGALGMVPKGLKKTNKKNKELEIRGGIKTTKCTEKKLNENSTRMLRAILKKILGATP